MLTPVSNNHYPRSAFVLERFQNLAGTLAELKVKVRSALATELASAIGTAVRDVLVVGIVDRLVAPPHVRNNSLYSRSSDWQADEDRGESRADPWSDDITSRDGYVRASLESGKREADLVPAIPPASAVAAGVKIGRWWLARQGAVSTALGLGIVVATLGLIGSPIVHTALSVIAAVSDLLAAESALVSISHL